MAALTRLDTEVRPNDHDPLQRLNYLLALEGEYYVVIAEREQNMLRFITAYPITAQNWRKYRQAGRAYYPLKKKKDE